MTHDERVYHHLYVESKSPLENAERIASLEELVEELQADNAKLRSELESVGTAAYLYGRSDLKAENDNLRSQCTDLVDERERLFQANVEKNGEVLRLVGENAKLREERREYQATIDSLVDECADYKAENAKLRELVRDWYELAVGGADSLTDWNHAQADLEQRMRELGVDL